MAKQNKKSKLGRIKFWIMVVVWIAGVNFLWQIYKNPIHVLSFFSQPMNKTPKQTWESYSYIFEQASTGRITSSFLAALAQAESSGNPLSAPDWSFQFSTDLTQIYAPASSAFGIMQITKGTFERILQTCGKSGEFCPTPGLATRMRAKDSVAMVAGYLHRTLEELIGANRFSKLSEEKIVKLASIVHLCGPEVGRRLVRNGYNAEALPRCGSHWPGIYTKRVWDLKNQFERLSRNSEFLAKN